MGKSKFAGLEKIKEGRRDGRSPGTGLMKTGLREDPEYRSVTCYMRRDTHHCIFAILHAKNDKSATFSGLVQQLMEEWLEKETGLL